MPQATAVIEKPQVNEIFWGQKALPLRFRIDDAGVVRMVSAGPLRLAGPSPGAGLPLAEVQLTGSGRRWSGERGVETAAGARLLYRGHHTSAGNGRPSLRIDLHDPATGLAVEVHYRATPGLPAVQTWTRLVNESPRPLVAESVTSSVVPGLTGTGCEGESAGRLDGITLMWADSDWLAEGRWQEQPLREALVDVNRGAHEHDPRGCFARSSQGSWSTGRHLPAGVLTGLAGGYALAWQIESSGGWRWEVGESGGGAYLALMGPNDRDHHWRQRLEPGASFTSVTAALVLAGTEGGTSAATGALAALTGYRRAIRRPHPDHTRLPVIFNDYMNTLMGDPTTERLMPLIDAAARAGAEYFVIDAGWYDDAGGWWDSVGAWKEAPARFPGGLTGICDHIRARGMTPGLWLEPEVIGVRSTVAGQLPDDAFFQRDRIRVVEHGRYHLDLRHPAARRYLDGVVDRLVADYGLGYLKLDYNINPGPGTDRSGSPGSGLLDHQRAHTQWLVSVLDRHPGLTIENCASGAMRADYNLLAHLQLQSTSDQQDHRLYPPIAAAAPAAIAPEQAAVWAYPQPSFSDDDITFTMAGALLGRIHLSGHLDTMTEAQHALVADAVEVYKSVRPDIASATPFWPLGLPGWRDPTICLGLRTPHASYLLLWNRDAPGDTLLHVPHLRAVLALPEVLYPATPATGLTWDAGTGRLLVTVPTAPSARLIRLTAR